MKMFSPLVMMMKMLMFMIRLVPAACCRMPQCQLRLYWGWMCTELGHSLHSVNPSHTNDQWQSICRPQYRTQYTLTSGYSSITYTPCYQHNRTVDLWSFIVVNLVDICFHHFYVKIYWLFGTHHHIEFFIIYLPITVNINFIDKCFYFFFFHFLS